MDYAQAFDEAKARVPIDECAMRYGLVIGRGDFCLCPYHSERTGSFKLYRATGTFYCYGCHASGTVIDLTMQLLGLSTPLDALRQLDADFGLALELDRPLTAEERERARQAQADRKRRADAAEALERWRVDTLKLYADLICEANTMNHEPTTPRDIALLRAREPLEYHSDLLMSADAEVILDEFLHREETWQTWVTPLQKPSEKQQQG